MEQISSQDILQVSVYFVWQWWEKYYQSSVGRPDKIDLDWMDETFLGRQRFLYENFGRFDIGSPNPQLDTDFLSKVMPFHTVFIPVALGMEVELKEVGGFHWKPFSTEKIEKLRSFDVSKSKIGEILIEQKEEKLKRYGKATQFIDLGSVTNNAFIFRGDEFYSDLIINKSLVNRCMDITFETMCMAYDFISNNFEKPIEGFPLGNCNVVMISPVFYEEMILPYDIKCVEFAAKRNNKPPMCDLHHCGVKTEPFAEAYSKIPGIRSLQGSYISDIEKIKSVMPNIAFSSMIDPVDFLNDPFETFCSKIEYSIAAGSSDLAFWNIDVQCTPQIISKAFGHIQESAAKYGKKAIFDVIPITWEELDWEFPKYGLLRDS